MAAKRPSPLFVRLPFAVLVVAACSGGDDERPAFRPGRAVYDTSKIELTGFDGDPALQQRILMMPFGEAAARLGSLRFDAVSSFEFSRGGEAYEQQDIYTVLQDVDGNFHIKLDTPISQVEYYLVGEDVLVRLDKGPLRKKARREVETEAICQIAFASIHQTLDLFRPQLLFTKPTPSQVGGRTAVRYVLDLAKAQPQPPADAASAAVVESNPLLPVSPPPKWRELARPLDLAGYFWIDNRTGVPLKSEIQGRLEIPDRDVRPTQLIVSFSAALSKIGEVKGIEAPDSVEEFRRIPPPRQQIEFFREHLPAPPPPPAPSVQPGSAPTAPASP